MIGYEKPHASTPPLCSSASPLHSYLKLLREFNNGIVVGKIHPWYTLPKINMSDVPLKGTMLKGNFIFQPSFFSRYANFQGSSSEEKKRTEQKSQIVRIVSGN